MAKFKVGDIVKPVSLADIGYNFKLIPESEYKVLEEYDGVLTVEGKFNNRDSGEGWSDEWFELAESKTTAESLRNSILEVRSKREELKKEVLRLDEQEKEAVEKLKEQGFVLYEDNVSKESAATENKAVLCAEDIEEDMTNPENWKVGDLILCVNGTGWKDWIDQGEVAEMVKEPTPILCLKTKYGVHKFGSAYYEDFRFHSRPVK